MTCVRDFLLSCLWLCLVVCRVTCVSCEEQSVKRDPRELLFAPERLLPSGSSLTVTVTIWREKSHLRPWSNRRSLPCCYWLVLLAGDIETNPGPVKFPFSVCSKPVMRNQRGILCSRCEKWTHAKCCGVSPVEYQRLGEHEEDPWYCPDCLMRELPFLDATLSSELSDNDSGDDDGSEVVDREISKHDDLHVFIDYRATPILCHPNVQSLLPKIDEVRAVVLDARRPVIL